MHFLYKRLFLKQPIFHAIPAFQCRLYVYFLLDHWFHSGGLENWIPFVKAVLGVESGRGEWGRGGGAYRASQSTLLSMKRQLDLRLRCVFFCFFFVCSLFTEATSFIKFRQYDYFYMETITKYTSFIQFYVTKEQVTLLKRLYEPLRQKTHLRTSAPSEDSDQPAKNLHFGAF